jgi:hypothetical protein
VEVFNVGTRERGETVGARDTKTTTFSDSSDSSSATSILGDRPWIAIIQPVGSILV